MAQYRVPNLDTFFWQDPVISETNNPPGSPAKGNRYAVSDTPTGAWVGHAFTIAAYDGSGWLFTVPMTGWAFWDIGASYYKYYSGSAWMAMKMVELSLVLTDVVSRDVSISAHGFCPKAPNDASKFLRGDASWAVPAAVANYALAVVALNLATLADGNTYYFGSKAVAPSVTAGRARIFIPKAGAIKAVYLHAYFGTVGTTENVSFYVRKNDTTDTLIETLSIDGGDLSIFNTSLNIAVAVNDSIEIKMVCPTWSTNPANMAIGGSVYIE